MNIKRAKKEIKDTIEAYLLKDAYGEYVIPQIRQRPVLLLGAPGIGKTQIMEQIARECGIGLVAYTITHHTRQSAIGLPFISKQKYEGREFAVTEYTMSEIVASIYEKMEATGLKEGILFIDEINCVSETLAPAMLQFLQCKTFGSHEIPQGWIIAAAGNPPEYNSSVREFDVVTMDRVKKIEVEPDYGVWKEYALQEQLHPAVISYLDTRPGSFYKMETTVDGRKFATPRGWEDLSQMLQVYESLGKEMDREVVIQYIQHDTIARDFAGYLELYRKYQAGYQIDAILNGQIDEMLLKKAAHAAFDERLSVVSLMLSRCRTGFAKYIWAEEKGQLLFGQLKQWKQLLLHASPDMSTEARTPAACFASVLSDFRQEMEQKRRARLLTRIEERLYRQAEETLECWLQEIKIRRLEAPDEAFRFIKASFDEEQDKQDVLFGDTGILLEHVFDFFEAVSWIGQEMVIFLTELNLDFYSIRFLQQYECERYYRYNRELLCDARSQSIEARLRQMGK